MFFFQGGQGGQGGQGELVRGTGLRRKIPIRPKGENFGCVYRPKVYFKVFFRPKGEILVVFLFKYDLV